MGKIKSAYRDLVSNRRERDHLGNLSVEKIILKLIFKK